MEALFARQMQSEAFLLLLAGGLALGALLQGLGVVRRRMPRLAVLTDVLFAATVLALMLGVMLRWMDGVRLYALLGVALGMLLYEIGIRRMLSALIGRIGRRRSRSPSRRPPTHRASRFFRQTAGKGKA